MRIFNVKEQVVSFWAESDLNAYPSDLESDAPPVAPQGHLDCTEVEEIVTRTTNSS